METKAFLKHLRISPRKVRLVVDLVRGMKAQRALEYLEFVNKKSSKPLIKLINSAVANSKFNYDIKEDNLYIKTITVGEGPTLKRWRARAFGKAAQIRKRTSHINLVLAEIKDSGKKQAKKVEIEKPIKLGEQAKQVMKNKKEEVKTVKDRAILKKDEKVEKIKEAVDAKHINKSKYNKIEGDKKGFVNKEFRRKSG